MSIIKSFSVGEGDMFYIEHNSDSFTIIDCFLSDYNKEYIVAEIKSLASKKGIIRFISTHPDDDHIGGIKYLDSKISIVNFYCVKNETTKEDDTDDFQKYRELHGSKEKAFYLYLGCSRKWINQSDETRQGAGINFYWPDTTNQYFIEALENAKAGGSPNNISPIFTYGMQDGVIIMWMGDLETEFMENIKDDVQLSRAHILFAPHHGRNTGKVPEALLKTINPKIIVIGEAASEDLNYYAGYNTITQNTAGDIILDCVGKKVHIYVKNNGYSVEFLDNEYMTKFNYYIGTLNF
ncbi:MAG: hypothetical protein PHD29_06475 [bacterium]|nr:hypothetical protein [bacterium]